VRPFEEGGCANLAFLLVEVTVATLREAVLDVVQADAPLNAILMGGVYDRDELGREGLTLSNVQFEADGVSIKPTGVLTWGVETPELEGYGTRGRRRFASVWVYSHDSYSTIEAALRAAEDALHRTQVATDDAGTVLLVYANDGPDFQAEELGNAFGRFARFYIVMGRR
jgi:hypothetical protein